MLPRRSMTSTKEVQEAGERWRQHFKTEHSEAAVYLARLAEPLVPITLMPRSASPEVAAPHAAKHTPPHHASPTDPFSLAASDSDAAAASGLPTSPRLPLSTHGGSLDATSPFAEPPPDPGAQQDLQAPPTPPAQAAAKGTEGNGPGPADGGAGALGRFPSRHSTLQNALFCGYERACGHPDVHSAHSGSCLMHELVIYAMLACCSGDLLEIVETLRSLHPKSGVSNL